MAKGKKEIIYSGKFLRSLWKRPKDIQSKAFEREKIFRENLFDARLDTHKLHGKLRKVWAFSVTGKVRIFFTFTGAHILFLDIDDHDFYK